MSIKSLTVNICSSQPRPGWAPAYSALGVYQREKRLHHVVYLWDGRRDADTSVIVEVVLGSFLEYCKHFNHGPFKGVTTFEDKIEDLGENIYIYTVYIHVYFVRIVIAPPFIISVLATDNWPKVKLKSVRTLFKIIYLESRKSYLLIICPNAYTTLIKSEIMSSWNRFEYCSKSLIMPLWSHICSLLKPIHMKTKSNIRSSLSQFKHFPKSFV